MVGMDTFDAAAHPRSIATGQFAVKVNDAPRGGLDAPATPVNGQVYLQAWDSRDNLIEVSHETVDLRRVLDTFPLSTVRRVGDLGGTSEIADWMHSEGLINHDGPYDVYLDEDDVAEYLAEREAAGQEDPLTTSVHRTADEAKADLLETHRQIQELQDRARNFQRQFVAATLRGKAPTATRVLMDYNRMVITDAGGARVQMAPLDEAETRAAFAELQISGLFDLT